MYSTSLKTWACAVGIDSILIGALVAGVIFHTPYALEVSVFFMWWTSVLGIIFSLLIALMPAGLQSGIEALEIELEFYKGNEAKTKELTEKLGTYRLALENLWSLLVIAGHPILATFKVASFLIRCILIGVARKKYRERLGIKTPDDIEEEFAKHRAHVRQVNNVVDDKTTK